MKRPQQRAKQDRDGKPVYLADRDQDLVFALEDFDGSTPGTTDNCVIVHTCKRQLGAIAAEVGRSTSYVEFDKFFIRYRTLGLAKVSTIAFDVGALLERTGGRVTLGRIPASGRKPRVAGVVGGSGKGNPSKAQIDNPLLRPRIS